MRAKPLVTLEDTSLDDHSVLYRTDSKIFRLNILSDFPTDVAMVLVRKKNGSRSISTTDTPQHPAIHLPWLQSTSFFMF